MDLEDSQSTPLGEVFYRYNLACPDIRLNNCPGWAPTLEKLFCVLKAMGWDGRVVCLKEKFGGLRCHLHEPSEAMLHAVNWAEAESIHRCMTCGAMGRFRTGRNLAATLCFEHYWGWERNERHIATLVGAALDENGRDRNERIAHVLNLEVARTLEVTLKAVATNQLFKRLPLSSCVIKVTADFKNGISDFLSSMPVAPAPLPDHDVRVLIARPYGGYVSTSMEALFKR